MRHNVYGKKLSRNRDERDVLFKGLVQNLFSHGTIKTSESKAKAIKGLVDKIITLAKSKTSRRLIQSYFNNKELENRLIKELLPKFDGRVSGYTSIIKLGRRLGDNTMVVKMSLIGAEDLQPVKVESRIKDKELSRKTDDTTKNPSRKISKTNTKTKSIKKGVKKLNS